MDRGDPLSDLASSSPIWIVSTLLQLGRAWKAGMEFDWCWCEQRPSGGQHSEDGSPLFPSFRLRSAAGWTSLPNRTAPAICSSTRTAVMNVLLNTPDLLIKPCLPPSSLVVLFFHLSVLLPKLLLGIDFQVTLTFRSH